MSLYHHIQTAFTGGEVSPRLVGRVDNDQYKRSCKTLTNALPFYHGGVKRRAGTLFVDEVRNSAFATKLIPFVYSRTQSYVCVFNNGYVQFIKNGEFVEVSAGVRYELAHPYLTDELNEVRFAQFGNNVYLTHPFHPPQKLSRLSDVNWTLAPVPFIHKALTGYTYENSFITFNIIPIVPNYTAGDYFTMVTPAGGGVSTNTFHSVTTPLPTGLVVAAGKPDCPAETWTVTCVYADSLKQEWSVVGSVSGSQVHTFTTNNYPAAVAFYQQRMFLAGTPFQPQTVWGSAIGDYVNLTIGPNDVDGVQFTAANSSNDLILHLAGSPNNLLIQSYANEFIMESSNGVYTSKTAIIKPQTRFGCNLVAPIRVGPDVVFVQRDGIRVRAIGYDISISSNKAKDLTIVSEHITESGIIDSTFQQDPDYVVWFVRKDGVMCSMTYLDEQEVIAWAKHTTDGLFKALTCIPENNSDRTYVVVERVIDGEVKKYIESIDYILESQTDSTVFGYSETAKTTWNGLGHLEGKLVTIVADGSNASPKLVTGGSVTLDLPAKEVAFGLPFTTTVELLHPNPDNVRDGTARGRSIGISELTLVLDKTIGCRVNGEDVPFFNVGDTMDTAPVPFTGDKKLNLVGNSVPNNIKIEQVLPMPFTLLAVVMKIDVAE
jgi:hypothetical protein